MAEITKHIILGAGGAISNVLTGELIARGEKIKLVSRSGKEFKGIESGRADITRLDDTRRVIEDSSVVYLLVGLPYDSNIWKKQWPMIMQNTILGCAEKNAHLVFFDNVYMYGKVEGKMTETTPFNPCNKKGEIRAKIARQLLDEIDKGNVKVKPIFRELVPIRIDRINDLKSHRLQYFKSAKTNFLIL